VRKISGETVVPLGFGKGIRDAGVFEALLLEGPVDIVRSELALFGITGVQRIAALAEPYYVPIAPRHAGGPVATAAAIHLALSIPNFFVQHLPIPADPGIPGYYEWIDKRSKIDAAIKSVQLQREALSPSVASMIVREVEPLNLLFIEKPCPRENVKAMARIARRSTNRSPRAKAWSLPTDAAN
jgi:L-alanine-DL-glutamate epimerase-like enolase superfamily enzyme